MADRNAATDRSFAIPNAVCDFLTRTLGQTYVTTTDDIGCNSHVSIFTPSLSSNLSRGREVQRGFVLKQPRNSASAKVLKIEIQNLIALARYFPIRSPNPSDESPGLIHVPTVVNEVPAGISLTGLLPGVNAAQIFSSASKETRFDLVRSLARALQSLHSLSLPRGVIGYLHDNHLGTNPTVDENAVDSQYSSTHRWFRRLVRTLVPLAEAKAKQTSHVSNRATSELVKQAEEASRLTAILISYADLSVGNPYWTNTHSDKMVLLHGDFMLPNILVTESARSASKARYAVSGLVDWGDAGMGDARYDVWSCIWSIKLNARFANLADIEGQEFAAAFLKEYDPSLIDSIDDFKPWEALYEIWDYVSFS